MAKHTWLVKPSRIKADRISEVMEFSERNKLSQKQRETLAGYYVENIAQRGNGRAELELGYLLRGCTNNKWRILNGKNGANYRLTVQRHKKFLAYSLIEMVWDRLRNDDLDFVESLDCRDVFLPHLDSEGFDEFRKAVMGSDFRITD